jgi:hypothetical protein
MEIQVDIDLKINLLKKKKKKNTRRREILKTKILRKKYILFTNLQKLIFNFLVTRSCSHRSYSYAAELRYGVAVRANVVSVNSALD